MCWPKYHYLGDVKRKYHFKSGLHLKEILFDEINEKAV